MIALLQRVSSASVAVSGARIASIPSGLLVLVGVECHDDLEKTERLATRVLTYRVFPDANGKMNLSVQDTGGALLLVPQFTLAADTNKGTRASFTRAAEPEVASRLFDRLVSCLRARGTTVECGKFGAEMSVALTNEGPVTFWLQV
jgi:D-tyrosyl-tRNA(Tyr) deacylase